MVIGLTGGIGTGKTTVAKMFAKYANVAVYIADLEAKKMMNSSSIIQDKIKEEFGDKAYLNNALNRAYISEIVFKNPEKLKSLNTIVHPMVRQHFIDFKKKHANKSYVIYEAAILFEANADRLCDMIISVSARKETRIHRVLHRDGISRAQVESRIRNQWKEHKKQLLSNYLIINEDFDKTKLQVQRIHNILTKKQ